MALLDQFILFGDSITEMANDQTRGFAFASQLQNAYQRKLDIINRGFSGYNTKDALVVLPDFFPTPQQAQVRFLLVFFGANDASLPTANTGQYVPPPIFASNLKTIITSPVVTAHRSIHPILVTPPPFEETTMEAIDWEFGAKWINRTAEHTKLYADAVKAVGKEMDLPVVDLWSRCMERAGWDGRSEKDGGILPGDKRAGQNQVLKGLLFDGLHLSPTGYQLLYDEVLSVLSARWPDQAPEKLKTQGYNPWDVHTDFTWGTPAEKQVAEGKDVVTGAGGLEIVSEKVDVVVNEKLLVNGH